MCMQSCEQQRCSRGSGLGKSFLEEGEQPGEVTLTLEPAESLLGGLQEGEELAMGGSCRSGVQECLTGGGRVDM